LSEKHKKHLIEDRGMTLEEIDIRGYRSFPEKPWEPFLYMEKRDYKGFPGMYTKDGKKGKYWLLNNMGEGILIPFYNHFNQIVGWQIRLDNPKLEVYCKSNFPDRFRISHQGDGKVLISWDG